MGAFLLINRRIYMKKSLLAAMLLLMATVATAQPLTRAQAEQVRNEVVDQWYKEVRQQTDYITTANAIERDSLRMPISCRVFGKLPPDGYSLYISLHGGGNAPHQLNDQQWQNQWGLYAPAEGIYICPRAPYDDWDMHFKPAVDNFYRDIILYAYSHLRVNPDKVYILGYSAGGDGVWRLAPRMADVWAAASMMAGHPGDVSLLNLRNLPFMVWCGALDAAYDRNRVCAERIAQLDSLHRADPDGYIHEGHIVEGKPHWMDRVDTLAISWMAQYKRNPYPKTIVWQQADVLYDHFYWVSVPKEEMARGKQLRIRVEGNDIIIEKSDYDHLTLNLTDEIVDFDRSVRIRRDGKTLKRVKLQRSRTVMERTIRQFRDPRYAFYAQVEI